MHSNQTPRGVVAAMDTPFEPNGAICEHSLRSLCDYLIEGGVAGLFLCGGTGQVGVTTVQERRRIVEIVLGHVGGSIPTWVHVGTPRTEDSLALLDHAAEHGAGSAVLSAPDWYYRHEPAALQEEFRCLASHTELPVFIYRRPWDRWTLESLEALRLEFPNILGVKDSSAEINLHVAFLALEGLAVYQGYEPMGAASLTAGSNGLISGLATVFPGEVVKLYDLFTSGDVEALSRQQQRVNRLVEIMYRPSPYRRFKTVLKELGQGGGGVRRPFLPMTPEEREELFQKLRSIGGLGF